MFKDNWFLRIGWLFVLVCAVGVTDKPQAAAALPVVLEQEPNDEPLDAATFTAPAVLSGNMVTAGDQDAYRWQISDAQAQQLWTLTLVGMPEALTGLSLIQLTLDDAGKRVIDRNNLVTFGIRDGSRPVTHQNLILPPGELVVGIFGAGQAKGSFRPAGAQAAGLGLGAAATPAGTADAAESAEINAAYRLRIEAGEKINVQTTNLPLSRDKALKLRLGSRHAVVAAGSTWYQVDIPESANLTRYTIDGGIDLTRTVKVELQSANGRRVSDASGNKFGQFVLPNLALESGTYFLHVMDTSDKEGNRLPVVRAVRWQSVGQVVAGEEQEPNAKWMQANVVDFAQPIQAQIDKSGDTDVYEFTLDSAAAAKPWQLVFASDVVTAVSLCLLDTKGRTRQCRKGAPPVMLPGLTLNEGKHGVKVERSTGVGAYNLSLQPAPKTSSNAEQEPNDLASDASVFGKKRLLKGSVSVQDVDEFLLLSTLEPQLWRLQAIGSGFRDLRYLSQNGIGGQSVRANSTSRRVRLDNLFLLPGQHRFSLGANKEADYVLRAIPLGPPSPYVEREPNNDRNSAHSMTLNKKAVALLTEPTDRDTFRWYLAAPQAVRLSLRPAPDAEYIVNLKHDGGQVKTFNLPQGTSLAETLWLDPGDYYLSVTSKSSSEVEYEVQVDQLPQLPLRSDVEPNDNVNTAAPWPASWHFSGQLGVSRAAVDWYRLPPIDAPLVLHLPALKQQRLRFVDANRKTVATAATTTEGEVQITLPASDETYLYLSGSGTYDFDIKAPEILPLPRWSKLPLQLALAQKDQPVAAYAEVQQQASISLTVHNPSEQDIAATLQASTTDDKWQLQLPSARLAVAAGGSITLDLTLKVEPDAWPDLAVQLRVIAEDDQRRRASIELGIVAQRQAVPLAPAAPAPVPPSLRGHINVAAAARGAKWRGDASKYKYLNDEVLALAWFFQSKRDGRTGPATEQPVLALAGERSVRVSGVSLHPFGLQDGQPTQRNASKFAVDLSLDGETFETVLSGRLQAQTREQFFALPRPQLARYARLRLLDSKDPVLIALGEWKVLADPASLAPQPANLAEESWGGHIMAVSPPLPTYGHALPMLRTDDRPAGLRMRSGFDASWVMGFHHNRAARIGHITWTNSDKGNPFAATRVLVSRYSPMGPWIDLGNWELNGTGQQVFELDEPQWARFVKFDVADGKAAEVKTLPDQIRIIEAPDASGSILGEWGYDSRRGPFELTQPPVMVSSASTTPQHRHRNKARSLAPNTVEQGVVKLGAYSNWYQVTVPQGHNRVNVELKGSPVVRVQAKLLDSTNTQVPLKTLEALPDKLVLEAKVAPGIYDLEISEPPRSVVFSWDTSGSTHAARPIIRQAVRNYVTDIKPGLDEAQMLPFGGDFLSRQWLDQPYQLQGVLNDYNGAGNSSAAEAALVKATTLLKDRVGQKIIVLITDAATSTDGRLWSTLQSVRPRIIALGVSSKGAFSSKPRRERDLMQDWASVGGGYYEYVENVGSMQRAFDRASAKIRQPATYTVELKSRFEPEPDPGFCRYCPLSLELQPMSSCLSALLRLCWMRPAVCCSAWMASGAIRSRRKPCWIWWTTAYQHQRSLRCGCLGTKSPVVAIQIW